MASITDCVVEGLKYPFNDIKKLLCFGVLFALISALSTFASQKSFEVARSAAHMVENANVTMSYTYFSQFPAGDTYLIAGLAIISFIVSLFILGYQYNVVKFSIEKRDDLPGFSDIMGMFINGIKYFLVVLAYNIVPVILFAGGIFLADDSLLVLVPVLISMLLFIIANFFMIMALNNMIAHDSLKKAFDFREITDNISNLGWGKYIGIIIFTIIVFMIVMAAVGMILNFITTIFVAILPHQILIISAIIAIIEGLLVESYGAIFYNRVFGSIYREAIK